MPLPLVTTLRFVLGHPLNRGRPLAALRRYLQWQAAARLAPGPVVVDWVNGTRMLVHRGETGLTGNVYCGLHEFADMAYVLHALGPEDLFVDVGANVGSYSLLACAARGARGLCFEPAPATYARLLDNVRLNRLEQRLECLNLGVGEREGELEFTLDQNCTNHVAAPGEAAGTPTAKVRVVPLDMALQGALQGQAPALLKIDVEGFEQAVIAGAARTLAEPRLHSIVMELNGSGARYGYDEAQILRQLQQAGFEPCAYDPWQRRLSPLQGKNGGAGNTLFVRGVEAMQHKLRAAPAFSVQGRQL